MPFLVDANGDFVLIGEFKDVLDFEEILGLEELGCEGRSTQRWGSKSGKCLLRSWSPFSVKPGLRKRRSKNLKL